MSIAQVLIGKSVAYALKRGGGSITTQAEINDLDDGAIAIFTEDNVLLDGANEAAIGALLADAKKFYIAVGGATSDKTRVSKMIDRKASVSGLPYAAPVNERLFIGDDGSTTYDLNLPTIVAGLNITLVVQDKTELNLSIKQFAEYTYTTIASDTQTTAVTALIAKINADPNRRINATGVTLGTGNAGIQIDYIYNYDVLAIYGADAMADAPTITKVKYPASAAIAQSSGTGTGTQIVEKEAAAMINEGDGKTIAWGNELFSYVGQASSSLTYHQYIFNWTPIVSYPHGLSSGVPQHLILAVVMAAAQLTKLIYIFGALSKVGTYAPETGVSEETNVV